MGCSWVWGWLWGWELKGWGRLFEERGRPLPRFGAASVNGDTISSVHIYADMHMLICMYFRTFHHTKCTYIIISVNLLIYVIGG